MSRKRPLTLPGLDLRGSPPSAARLTPRRAVWVASASPLAADVLGPLTPGCRVHGVTKGQFGLTELLGAVLAQVGPGADVVAWCWSCHDDDARMLGAWRTCGDIARLTMLVDRSFPARQPQRMAAIGAELGEANIYATNTHAKVCLVARGAWRVVIQSSMNFNVNHRFEHFSVEDDSALWEHWQALTDWLTGQTTPGLALLGAQYHAAFKGALQEELPEGEGWGAPPPSW